MLILFMVTGSSEKFGILTLPAMMVSMVNIALICLIKIVVSCQTLRLNRIKCHHAAKMFSHVPMA